jgi:hypothetical protein
MRLGPWQKSSVFASMTIVAVSGIAWWGLHDLILDEPGDITRILLMLHGVSAYVLLVVVGSLIPVHIKMGWRRGHRLASGISMVFALLLLAVTALVLYYGSEETRNLARWLHIGFGMMIVVAFPIHAVVRKMANAS